MTILLLVLFAMVATLALVYFAAPGVVFNWATTLGRRSAGLKLAEADVAGHRIAYLHGGAGETLLLLHGFGANKDHWTMIARLLTPHFRVVMPDLPGFGDSSRHDAERYGLDEQLVRLARFADGLELGNFHLGGNSMGGYLASHFALRFPGRVKSLWLLAPAGVMSAEKSETMALLEAGENPLVATDMVAFDRLAALCFCKQPYMPAQFKRPLLARATAEASFNTKIFNEMFVEPVALETSIAGLAVRTLVVWGDDDRVLHPSALGILRPLLSDAEFILMRDMGHVPMIERPAETAMDFLRFQGRMA